MDYREKIIHGDEGLPVAIYEISPEHIRYRMNVHWHPEHEILHVRRGEITVRINDTTLHLRAGDVAFIAGGSIHSAEPRNCDYTCILVNLTLLMKKSDTCMSFAHQISDGSVKLFPRLSQYDNSFSQLCTQLLQAYREKKKGYPFIIKSIIFSFFGTVLNEGLFTEEMPHSSHSESNALRMKTVLSYIEQHYGSPIRLRDLAAQIHISPNHFCRSFKEVTGQTPFEYITSYRLAKAQHALRTTDMGVTETALACGFNDVSHFIRLFRETYGVTPKRFQRSEDAEI
ncbi:MAG: AraC family transcriptional regulator [Clostridia bacterium]|nr:AraC family transcriptional regulator [Clostridia bacterium]